MTTYLIALYVLGVVADILESRMRTFPVSWRNALIMALLWPVIFMAGVLRKVGS